jgi:hypothetical protein
MNNFKHSMSTKATGRNQFSKDKLTMNSWIWMAGLIVSFLGVQVQAAPVTKGEAAVMARGWLQTSRAPLGETLNAKIRSVNTTTNEQGEALYYVVALAPEGFVICSADTAIEPILAFSASGQYENDPLNPLQALMEKDARGRMKRVRMALKSASQTKAESKWTALRNLAEGRPAPKGNGLGTVNDLRVDAFVQSRWNQGSVNGAACYNYFTPPYGAGNIKNYVSGCNNTAWAQLMRYYRYPTRPVGTRSCSIRVDGVATSRNLRGGDGAGGAYRWDLMPLVPASPSTAEREAIGALVADIGVASGTSFAPGGSGAWTSEQTLKDTFFFGSARTFSGLEGFADAVRPNLDARMPVLLSIWGAAGGHAVLCDGYGFNFSSSYYHLNLGWGGQKDAWYNLPVIDTDWYRFDELWGYVCNIYTNGTGEIISGRVLAEGVPVAGATVSAVVGGQTYSAVSDARGIYALARLPSSQAMILTAQKNGLQFNVLSVTTGVSSSHSGNSWGHDFSSLDTDGIAALAVTPIRQSIGCSAETAAFFVTNAGAGTMPYVASESESWLDISGGARGTYSGAIMISCQANPGATARTGTIVVVAPGASNSPMTLTVVQAPTFLTTSGGDFPDARRPSFTWSAMASATWYQIWINRNGQTYETRWVSGATTWTPSVNGLPGGSYQWWVRPWSPATGCGAWAGPASFTISTAVPGELTQIAPEEVQADRDLTYRWQKDENATWYRLFVGRGGAGIWHDKWFELSGTGEAAANPGGANLGAAKPIQSVPQGAIESNLPTFQWAGGACEWWLRGWGPDGYGPWTGPKAFSVPNQADAWYHIYVSRGSAKVLDQWTQGTSLSAPTTLSTGAHSWWIGVWDPQTGQTIWSERSDFTVS